MKAEDLKLVVKEKYGEIASQSVLLKQGGCCGSDSCCDELGISMIGVEYNNVEGHNPDADLGLGCGIPTQFAAIKPGDSVLDLGSGAGNDCFVARTLVGETGKVTGIDFTDEMIEKANNNLAKTGFTNIEFVKGDIEEMPLPGNNFDIIISNCVLNLVPDKHRAFSEVFRVLKPGGHFCISDVVLSGELPDGLKQSAAMYAGCVAGALQKEEYLGIIENQGLTNIQVHKERNIEVPVSILEEYISEEELDSFKKLGAGICSITVSAKK
ncbi:MAG: arsenite methyltransferase [Draconibacterium sp.]|nr:arsenite methyltransferase [Draconibacterium sp.]